MLELIQGPFCEKCTHGRWKQTIVKWPDDEDYMNYLCCANYANCERIYKMGEEAAHAEDQKTIRDLQSTLRCSACKENA